jgi:hypothetical protein
MPFERDYVKRQIKQLVDALARAIGIAKKEQRYDDALEAVKKAPSDLLGIDGELLERVDAASAARILGDRERVEIYAAILDEEAGIHSARGEPSLAARVQARASALRATLGD